MRAIIRASAALSRVRTGEASRAATSSGMGSGADAGSSTPAPPMEITCATVRMPSDCSRNNAATAPSATREAVSRALERSSTGRASSKPYLRMPVRSAWPGRGRLSGALRPSRGRSWSSGSALMTWVHLGHSVLPISMAIGEPSVSPCRTPVSSRTWSCSNFMRAPRPYPRRRRARAPTISCEVTRTPAGIPSIMATSASPCDSPAVCQRNMPVLLGKWCSLQLRSILPAWATLLRCRVFYVDWRSVLRTSDAVGCRGCGWPWAVCCSWWP